MTVNPLMILSKSGEIKNIRANLGGILSQIEDKILSLNKSWESEASQTYQSQFARIRGDIEEMLRILDGYTRYLDDSAESYMTAEQKARQTAEALPGDVFGT